MNLFRKLIQYSPYYVPVIVFVLICLISYQIYEYNHDVNKNNQDIEKNNQDFEKFNGFQPSGIDYKVLLETLLQQTLKSKIESYNAEFSENLTPDNKYFETHVNDSKWIPYASADGMSINYSGFDRINNGKSETTSSNTNQSQKNLRPTPTPKPKPTPELKVEKQDKYIAYDLLKDLMGKCEKSNCQNYVDYNNRMWELLFKNNPANKIGIGKIYVASGSDYAYIFPNFNRTLGNQVDFDTRKWWKSANGDAKTNETDTFLSSFKEINVNTDNLEAAGVTKPYIDIADKAGNTDLTRTIWVKFTAFGKRPYIFCVDLRLKPGSLNLVAKNWYEIVPWYESIPLVLLLLLLPFLIHLGTKIVTPPEGNLVPIYKLQRLIREPATVNQKDGYKVSKTQSVKNTDENVESIKASKVLSIETKLGDFVGFRGILEFIRQRNRGNLKTNLIEINIEKEINLDLKNAYLKAFELWKVLRPNNDKETLGLIGVFWNTSSDNDITFDKYFWDSDTSAAFDPMKKGLKKHLYATENDTFLFDQIAQSDIKPEIVGILEGNLGIVKDFQDKYDSFNNRVLLLDDSAEILKNLYLSQESNIFATCSIEFLDYLKKADKLKEILEISVRLRFIIDGDKRKFKDFYKGLNDGDKEFIKSRTELKIIEYKEAQEVIYRNRDFCIVSFGEHQCVFYTDFNNAQQGWISWRKVDIDYYEAIKSFIQSVEKKSLATYIGIHCIEP